MVAQFKKAYLHRPNQDSTFSHTRKNSNMFKITLKYFSFFSNKPPASWVVHRIRDCVNVIPVPIIIPWLHVCQITNFECLRDLTLPNLVSHHPCYVSSKMLFNSFFCWCLLSPDNVKFFQLSTDAADSKCRANLRNQQKFLTPADLHFFFNEIVKGLPNYVLQVILNAWIWGEVQEDIDIFYLFFFLSSDTCC